ncbi:caspase family protein [Leptolyngbya cf. ectocarpi LEGE 11479]|uniref:Caspase family protein n=1 Tax=Leptolyngbya cf. ectocarpi LEGE 11479 TaxID=1828722 RepID=A0A928ZZW4_LEPEC|nr:caspase family protein [Leptolyngbya ectocarpi]MBE9070592.1 caspase family protein [Leptolyngbya cf. ectocarpi LEGE 11479]
MSRDALIVGINQYQDLPRLTAAAKDAEGIAALLETYGNFRVRRLPEMITDHRPQIGQQTLVSTQQLENSLVRLLVPKGDHIPEAVFFYFSGHGLQREIGIREGYLAASDTRPDTANSGLSLSWLRRLIRHSPVRQIIVILDCCHSGEFLSLKDESWQGCDGQSYLFIAASREYEEAYESLESDYSVLTQALLSGLLPQQTPQGRITSTDLVASITNQLSQELQQPLFEQGGSEIVITQQSGRHITQKESISIISRLKQYCFNFCPYRGLQPFEEKHADYYFGRETLLQDLLQALQDRTTCALVGASGSGKTSLLRAGLIPRLAAGHDIPGSEHWLVRYVQLGAQPLKNLAAAFTIAHQEITVANELLQAEQLLRHEPNGLVNLVTAALMQQPTATKFWLIIDQFEALFTPTTDPHIQQERQQIIHILMTALCNPSVAFGVIIGVRSNAMDGLMSHGELFSLIDKNRFIMPPMSYQNIRDVIEKPAEKVGFKIDPYLIHNLTLDLTGAPGELALLQMTLYELWRHRTPTSYSKGGPCLSLESYMKLGRCSKLLIHRATDCYQSLSSEEQAAVQRIFIALCDLGEGRLDQCRSVRKLELVNQQFSIDLIERVLQKLTAARLIVSNKPQTIPTCNPEGCTVPATTWTTYEHEITDTKHWLVAHQTPFLGESRASEETVELAHKSLILDWPLLRQWLQHYPTRAILYQRRDLEERAWVWHHRGEPRCSDYLLGQQYLKDIGQFLNTHRQELSTLAQRYVAVSQGNATYQRWQTRGVAVLLPLAVMAGMTVSLVRHQLRIPWRIQPISNTEVSETTPSKTTAVIPTQLIPVSGTPLNTLLPRRWGQTGAKRLAITSQILDFNHRHPQSDLSQISVTQLANLMTPSAIITSSASLPDKSDIPLKFEKSE